MTQRGTVLPALCVSLAVALLVWVAGAGAASGRWSWWWPVGVFVGGVGLFGVVLQAGRGLEPRKDEET